MNSFHLAEVDKALLFISEARERAEQAARAIKGDGAEPHLVSALEDADRDLLAVHATLMRAAYFPTSGRAQLALAASD